MVVPIGKDLNFVNIQSLLEILPAWYLIKYGNKLGLSCVKLRPA